MFDKLTSEEQRYEDLMRLLGTAEVQSDSSEYRKHAKALAELEPMIERFREYKSVVHDITQTEELAAGNDTDMRDLARGGSVQRVPGPELFPAGLQRPRQQRGEPGFLLRCP